MNGARRAETSDRYRTLDVGRAFAALCVAGFHCSNTLFRAGEHWLSDVLLTGWIGVFVFFPISGYCVTAAIHRPENSRLGPFLMRRWRRIFPPYWASLALAVAVAAIALPFNRGHLSDLTLTPHVWASVLTLTQGFIGKPEMVNPVYWSLCYQEQFYIVAGLTLLVTPELGVVLFALVTVTAAVYSMPGFAWKVPGLFLDYWLAFAMGAGVYVCRHRRESRWWGRLMLAVPTALAIALRNPAYGVSVATGWMLLVLHPWDRQLSQWRAVRWFGGLGLWSYSLYLVHVPIAGRVVNGLARTPLPSALIAALALAVSGATGYAFYVFVERRFINTRPDSGDSTKAPLLQGAIPLCLNLSTPAV